MEKNTPDIAKTNESYDLKENVNVTLHGSPAGITKYSSTILPHNDPLNLTSVLWDIVTTIDMTWIEQNSTIPISNIPENLTTTAITSFYFYENYSNFTLLKWNTDNSSSFITENSTDYYFNNSISFSTNAPETINLGFLNDTAILVPMGIGLSLLSLLTFVGNAMVLHAIRTEKRLQTVSNMFIMSLAVADLIVGLFVMPISSAYAITGEWMFGLVICQFWLSIDYTASTASIFNLFILSLDRYWSITSPLKYLKKRTKKRAFIMITIVWLTSALWIIPILGWHHFDNAGIRRQPQDVCETEFAHAIGFKVGTAFINFYIPMIFMIGLYGKIFHEIKKRSKFEIGMRTQGGTTTANDVTSESFGDNCDRKNTSGDRDEDNEKSKYQTEDVDPDIGVYEETYSSINSTSKTKRKQESQYTNLTLLTLTNPNLQQELSVTNQHFDDVKVRVEYISSESEDDYKETDVLHSPLVETVSSGFHCRNDHLIETSLCEFGEDMDIHIKHKPPPLPPIEITSDSSPCSSLRPSPIHKSQKKIKKRGLELRTLMSSKFTQANEYKAKKLGDLPLPKNSLRAKVKNKLRRSSKLPRIPHLLKKKFVKNTDTNLLKEKKAAKQLGVIMGAFVMCWLPYFVLFMVIAFCSGCIDPNIHTASIWLGYVNSTMNPFLYPLCNVNFKRAFKRMLSCRDNSHSYRDTMTHTVTLGTGRFD